MSTPNVKAEWTHLAIPDSDCADVARRNEDVNATETISFQFQFSFSGKQLFCFKLQTRTETAFHQIRCCCRRVPRASLRWISFLLAHRRLNERTDFAGKPFACQFMLQDHASRACRL